MVYIQLSNPVRDFTKVRIKEVSFFDTNGKGNLEKALGFKYQVFKKDGNIFIPLYERHINVKNEAFINDAMSGNANNMSAYEFICKQLLQYLINEALEVGTIEIE